MTKSLQDYNVDPTLNLELTGPGGISIPLGEGQTLPKHVNDGFRALMADLAIDKRANGRPAQRSNTITVTQVEDATSTGSFPAVGGKKLALDGALNPALLLSGTTDAAFSYTFDTSDTTNTAHVQFYEDAAQTTAYTTGVTVNGTAGTDGAYTTIAVTETTPRVLYYQVVGSAGLGGVCYILASDQAAASVTSSVAQAEAARDAALAAQSAAETAETGSGTSATASADSATASAASATAAASSASDAADSATNAATSETNAAASAAEALGYRNDAQTAAGNADTAYQNILASQNDNLWLGGKASDPTTDNDGNALLVGASYYNTTAGEVRAYNGTTWDKVSPTQFGDLGNVDLTGLVNGMGIAFDSGSGNWEPVVLGGAPSNDANNDISAGGDGGAYFDLSANSEFQSHGTRLTAVEGTAGSAVQPSDNVTLGTINSGNITSTGDVSAVNATLTGYLRGPANFTLDPAGHGDNTGTVVIAGNLQVDGTTTTINSTTMDVDDLEITVAAGAADNTAANGAGLHVDGSDARLNYQSAGDNWNFNKEVEVNDQAVMHAGKATSDWTALQTALDGKATSAQGALAASATQPGDEVDTLVAPSGATEGHVFKVGSGGTITTAAETGGGGGYGSGDDATLGTLTLQERNGTNQGALIDLEMSTDTFKWAMNVNGADSDRQELQMNATSDLGTNTVLQLAPNGRLTAGVYGSGTFTGTDAYWLAVTASGEIIEEAAPATAAQGALAGTAVQPNDNVTLGDVTLGATTIATDKPVLMPIKTVTTATTVNLDLSTSNQFHIVDFAGTTINFQNATAGQQFTITFEGSATDTVAYQLDGGAFTPDYLGDGNAPTLANDTDKVEEWVGKFYTSTKGWIASGSGSGGSGTDSSGVALAMSLFW